MQGATAGNNVLVPSTSAGLLVYRRTEGGMLEVLVVHPGGPYWARRDTGWWSIPKGEIAPGEAPLVAARREYEEELGVHSPKGAAVPLGDVLQSRAKRVLAFALEGDVDVSTISPGTFELEWPPRSGRRRRVGEIDRAQWCSIADARRKLLPAQAVFLTRLAAALADETPASGSSA